MERESVAPLARGFNPSLGVDVVDAVLDIDSEGQVLAIEVLGYASRYPRVHLPIQRDEASPPSLAVDLDADAIYLRLASGRAVRQRRAWVVVAVDSNQELQLIAA